MKRLCDAHRAEFGVEYVGMGDLQRQGACVVCEMRDDICGVMGLSEVPGEQLTSRGLMLFYRTQFDMARRILARHAADEGGGHE